MTDKEIRALIENRRKDWRYGNSVEAKYKAEECKDILELIDSMQEEPTSEPIDFEQELYKAFGQIKDFTLGMRIAKWFYEMGKNSQEPVSEELEKELSACVNSKEYTNSIGTSGLLLIARHFADWQKNKMMEDATDVTVHTDAGGYPYIPQIELYDYDKDIPLAKEGDKYKVVLIKEE